MLRGCSKDTPLRSKSNEREDNDAVTLPCALLLDTALTCSAVAFRAPVGRETQQPYSSKVDGCRAWLRCSQHCDPDTEPICLGAESGLSQPGPLVGSNFWENTL